MKNKKKILFLIPSLFGGGSERFTVNCANIFANTHNVYVAYYLDKKKKYKLDSRVKLIKLESKSAKQFFFKLFFYLQKNKDFKYIFSSIVHINSLLIIMNLFFFRKFKTIVRETNTPIGEIKYNLNFTSFFHYILRYLYMFADKIITPSETISYQLNKYFLIKKKKIFKIFNFTNISEIVSLSKKKNSKKNYVLNIGSITKQKNQLFLIKSFLAMKKNKKLNLLIIGNGNLKNEIKNFIREKKNKKYIFTRCSNKSI